jgi:DNA-binding SARP family transcriptional activator
LVNASPAAHPPNRQVPGSTSFRILGPIEVWNGEQRLEVGGPKQIALLALLLLHSNEAVSIDALSDALWGETRTHSQNRLQMAVMRLRRALAPLDGPSGPLLRTIGGGYLLSVASNQVDADVFTAAVSQGRRALEAGETELASQLLRDALAMCRGRPFAQGEVRRLEELRLVALEGRIEAELALGHHPELIGELQQLLLKHPTRERMAMHLMLALYRSGRQGDALEVYHQTRLALTEQLGLEPGPALKGLQDAILNQAPSLSLSPQIASAGPSAQSEQSSERGARRPIRAPLPIRLEPHGPADFVNRAREREALTAAVSDVQSPRYVWVTGEAGIGKTRLVSEVAAEAYVRGTLVLTGRCDEGLDLPYQPIVEALEHLIEHAPRELVDAHIERYGYSLARLVPGLAPGAIEAPGPASESERYVLFRAIEGLLAAASVGGTVLLVIEDLHWADPPTLTLLRSLVRSPRTWPLVLVSTCRTSDLDPEHPVRELLADLHREPRALRLDLRGLEGSDVGELLRSVADIPDRTIDEGLAATIESSTSGNPFFITELVRGLVESGAIHRADGRWELSTGEQRSDILPLSISETLERRIRRMADDVQHCLRVAAVVGTEFPLDLVSELADCPTSADALDLAVEAGVLLEVPGQPVRYRFAHALLQRYLYRGLGPGRRTGLHHRVACSLEARLLHGGGWPVAEVARHWIAAGDADCGKASRYARLAGDEAMAKLAPDEAVRWYAVALDLLGRVHDHRDGELCDLLIKRGEAERQAGEQSFRDTLLEAAELAQRIGDEDRLVRAVLANTRGMQSETGIVDEARVALLDEALSIVTKRDSPERARLLAMEAAELMYSSDWDRRASLSDEALAIARRLADPEALSGVLNLRFVTLLAARTHSERLANTLEAVVAAEGLNDPIALFFAYHWRGYAWLEAGDMVAARSWMAREREVASRFRQPTALWLARADEANLAIVAGELEAAASLAAEARDLGQHSEPDARVCYAAQQASIAHYSGRLAELVPMFEQSILDNPGVPGFRATLALALAESGRTQEAETILDREAATSFQELPNDVTWLAAVCIYAHVSAQLRHRQASELLYTLLAPWHEQIAFPAFGVWGPVELYLGLLARARGETELAHDHLWRAAEAADRAAAPLWKARAQRELSGLAQAPR